MSQIVQKMKIDSDTSNDDTSIESEHSDVQVLSSIEDGFEFKHHAPAVLIAIFASLVSFYHLSSGGTFYKSNVMLDFKNVKDENIQRNDRYKGYRRTYALNFCKDEEMSFSENSINKYGMDRFRFEYDSKLDETMISYIQEDDEADKSILHENFESFSNPNSPSDVNVNMNVKCIKANTKSFTFGTAPVFISPHISTFYKIHAPQGIIPGKEIKESYPSYTGFAAKFYNLSPNKLILWWEGGSGTRRRTRKIGEVAPFESIGEKKIINA